MYKLIVQWRSRLLVYLTHQLALPVLRLIRRPQPFAHTMHSLQQMPEGSLGNDLALMLEKNQLQLLPYYAKHDIKHVLLGYDATAEGEVCLQAFMLGNGHLSFPVAATVLFGLFTMPEYWSLFFQAYKKGSQCTSLENWQWLSLLEQPTCSLIQKISGHEENTL